MIILPAVDMYDKKAVRLYKGRYDEMTVYSDDPVAVARDFEASGCTHIHMVDLEGARDGNTPNIGIVSAVAAETSLFIEIGGGIRSMDVIEAYLSAGVSRVILGTAAVTDRDFLERAAYSYGSRIAVGADVRDGYIAIKGWLETSQLRLDDFMQDMQKLGISNVICTDISRDGAMRGSNLELYAGLQEKYSMDITASGGVSDITDVRELRRLGLYGAIIGKAYYTGAIDLAEAVKEAL